MQRKKIFMRVCACMTGVLAVIQMHAAPTIYGTMSANNTWSGWDSYEGVYSFQAIENTEITPVYTDTWDLAATAGGVLVDDIYHVFYDRGGSSMFSISYTAYHIDDWSVEYSCYFSDVIKSNDMTCDPTTDKVYCAQKQGMKGRIVRWNPANIEDISEIGTTDVEILAIAADAEGNLYGVGSDGAFYAIDKEDAALTKIGDTGVSPSGYQSAVFDYGTGALYWAAYTKNGKSALYSIDIASGEAAKITDFANNARFCGLYMLGGTASDDAPAAIDDFALAFGLGSNSGKATFTMPVSSCGGAELSGELAYQLSVDDVVIKTGNAQAGEKVELEIEVATGQHQFVLVASNDAGEGPRAKISLYVGKGVPGYVEEPLAETTEVHNQVIVSWFAPEYCIPEDAYFASSELRYSVVRMPDNVLVADHTDRCSLIDNIEYSGPLKVVSYEITSYTGDVKGFTAITNGVPVGDPIVPPYEAAMASVDLGFFTIIDANGDGSTWGKDFYNFGVSCGGRWEGDCDDWLILPPLQLEANSIYHTIISTGNDYDGASAYEVKIGQMPTAEAMTQTILRPTSSVNSMEEDIRVEESGVYYIGIHCIGAAGTTLYVADIIVRNEANSDAPDAPSEVSGVGAEKGELAAYVTFTMPTRTIGGDKLQSLNSAKIYHGEKLAYTLDAVEPGQEYTVKVEADQEFNTYSVSAVNDSGEGLRARVEYVFAGYDYPNYVVNLELKETDSLQPLLSWDAATEEGLYGYYVDPTQVVYEIYRGYGDGNYDLIEETYSGTSYIDEDLDLDRDQFMLQYVVYPVNSIGRGYGSASNSICVGRPYEVLFVEKFPNGNSDNNPWRYASNSPETAGWVINKNTDTTLEDIDGSNGLIAFFAQNAGDEATLQSPYVTVKGVSQPILEFYYYKDAFAVEPKVMIGDDVLANRSGDRGEGWLRYEASLADYTKCDRIRIDFVGSAVNGETYAFVDNIRVRQQYEYDMTVDRLIVPATMALSETSTVSVVVRNEGKSDAQDVVVHLYRNGYEVDICEVGSMDAGEMRQVDFEQLCDIAFGEKPSFECFVSCRQDDYYDNNLSGPAYSSIALPRYPVPTGLKAEHDGADKCHIMLSWDAPTATSMAPDPIVEDFEGYESFSIEFSPWTLVDGDKQKTVVMADPYYWTEDLNYPHSGEAMAYQIFAPAEAGIDLNEWWSYKPYSGDKAAVCWSTDDWSVANDDWMISPELYPGGQTISFYVYSRTGYFDFEKYELLYSPSGNDVNDFVLLAKGCASDDWTKVEVELPSDAKYFAIHTVSEMSNTEIWYDDICYIPASSETIPLDLLGYNIYRNRQRINDALVTETMYSDLLLTDGDFEYNVTAVYGVGESRMSEGADINIIGGISDAAQANVKVAGGHGAISITGAEGMDIAISNVEGMLIAKAHADAPTLSIPARPGIYIVMVGNHAHKVIVR